MSYIRFNNGNCMSTRGQSQITSDFLSENWFSPANDGKSELGNTTANIIANCICQVLHISLALIIINMILYFPSLFALFIFMPATADGCYWIQYNASQFTRLGPHKALGTIIYLPQQTPISLLWSSGKGQARIGKGWQSRRKASKLKPLPRAYTKVGCHHHHHHHPPTQTFNFT